YGPLVGRALGPVSNLLQTNVKQALESDPGMQIAISNRAYVAGGRQLGTAGGFGPGRGAGAAPGAGPGAAAGPRPNPGNPSAQLSPMFIETLGKEDTRRPRMDMGLGIWTGKTRRYYPMERIRERGEAFVDQLDGRKVAIYIDPETAAPAALFIDGKSARLQGKEIRLDNGAVIRSGVLVDSKGKRQNAERPQQMFTRWYGFALTFPGSEVFGQ
ncbi:MAG: hypothetical protein HYU27_08790, partial [Acidobacteria bacterium]|nr:hypothetical protein [Acidobacteriota bacterium]